MCILIFIYTYIYIYIYNCQPNSIIYIKCRFKYFEYASTLVHAITCIKYEYYQP